MGSMQNAVSTIPKSVTFGLYSAEEIRKLSVIEITNPISFNALGHPSTGGLYDPHMGPWSEKGDPCATCHLGPFYCPGHMGHLELPLPTFHPLFQRILISILKISCPSCKRLLCKDSIKAMLVGQMDLLDNGLITEAQKLAESIHVDEEDKETVEDLLDGGKPKKQKKTKTTASNQQREAMIKEEIENLIQELKRDYSGHTGTATRLTESLRQLFVKTFLGRISSLTSCASCKGGWKKIIFYKSRIVYVLKQGTVSTAVGGHEMTENLNDLETTLNEEDREEDPGKFTSKNKKKPALSNAMPTMYLTPNDAMDHLRELWRHDGDVLADLFPVLKEAKCENPTDVFFLQVLPICPPKFRPVNFSGGTLKENAQSVLLRKVVEDTYLVKAVLYAYKDKDAVLTNEAQRMIQSVSGATMLDKLQTVWLQLQADVDATVDASGKKELAGGVGFKQLIEKKEGLFRMNMMGKRVNFAARSVITPDPNIGVEEIGIPEVFAKKLTYPTPVTLWNYRELRQMVCNGPDVHPGAVAVEGENGRVTRLSSTDPLQREAAAKILLPPTEKFSTSKDLFRPKIVHRHLRTGDVMLLNRQPSLHKPSIMAHKARVLPGEKTLRLHYSNCKSYNADFDGDEMNAHFPQSELGRSEAYNIVAVPHQYLVPKDGTPLSGLIQDHIVSAVRLTKRGKFFNRADYQQLVYIALGSKGGSTKLLPPTLIKPVTLWSGKQIISTVVINLAPPDKPPINLFSKAKTSVKDWQTEPPRKWKAGGTPLESANAMTESEVIFRQGELICGVLDKMQHGATSFSLVHTFYELYGGEYSSKLLSAFGRLFTAFLQLEGFTLGVKDILLTPEADERRREILKRAETVGDVAAARAVGLDPEALKRGDIDRSELVKRMAEAHLSKTPLKRMTLDREYKVLVDEITNDVNRTCTPGGLLLRFPENNLALMVQSGAKGSTVNSMQISCLLGQIELEGKRPPLMISGRSLPSFIPYETSPRAGGFVAGRFMTGIRPQEFFIHCMAGREGLIDTAVKTSRSGYLQRCLIKHLEGIGVAYDNTVRDSDGTVIQFFYGEDGLDVCRSQYLSSSGLPIIIQNKDCLTNETKESSEEDKPGIKSLQKSIKRWKKKYVDLGAKKRTSPFAAFSSSFELPEEEPVDAKTRPGRSAAVDRTEAQWRRMDQSERKKYEKKAARAPAPVSSVYPMMSHENVLTEGLENLVDRFIKSTPCEISRSELVSLVYKKAVKGICEPGEPVGLLAAQSVGEPSTQMTLNTFHFAGRGEMNVTLGIPRLREVLMVASANIQTPSMDIPLKEKSDLGLKQAEKLRLLLSRVTLADVLERVDVTERLVVRGQRKRLYVLRFEFLPHSSYKDRFCVKPSHLLRYFETHFVHKILLPNMRKEADAQAAQGLFTAVSASRARATRTAAASGEDDGEANNRPDEESAGNAMRPDDDAQVDDESDLEGGNDADTEASRMRARHDDEHEYEEANEVISAAQPDVDQDEDYDAAAADDEGFEELIDEEKRDSQGEEDNEERKEEEEQAVTSLRPPKVAKTKSVSNEVALERRLKLLDKDPWIADYEFDMKKQRWCQLTVAVSLNVQKVDLSGPLRQWAESAVVHQVPNIKRAFVVPPKNEGGDVVIKTDGINIKAMFAHSDLLDVNRLYCNDIHAIARQYGIEAASRVVVNEVRNVFQVYGITVDPRHLSLIASYMTCSGEYRPFNRYGMAECASPLQQISFETATNFLRNATLQSKTDPLESPSARLVLGLPVKTGTGCFELLRKLY